MRMMQLLLLLLLYQVEPMTAPGCGIVRQRQRRARATVARWVARRVVVYSGRQRCRRVRYGVKSCLQYF